MKNFILSIAFMLGAIGANAGTALEANSTNVEEIITLDGCVTDTETVTIQYPDGTTITTTTIREVCD